MNFVWHKGIAAYELQIGRLYVRVTHLQGDWWRWRPWRRVSFHRV